MVHSQKSIRDHARQRNQPTLAQQVIAQQLEDLVKPFEETFNTLKRLLGLSYLWTGSINGIQLQLWATWLFYVVLIDLADRVAEHFALHERAHFLRNGLSWSLSFYPSL